MKGLIVFQVSVHGPETVSSWLPTKDRCPGCWTLFIYLFDSILHVLYHNYYTLLLFTFWPITYNWFTKTFSLTSRHMLTFG